MQRFVLNRCLTKARTKGAKIRYSVRQGFVLKPCLTKAHPKGAKKKRVNTNDVKDKISELPDEVLEMILRRLTMKEAARTTILSHRWCNIWTRVPSLNFDHSEVLPSLDTKYWAPTDPTLIQSRSRYVEWVNLVLRLYRRSILPLDEFRVRFDLDANFTDDIDNWVRFVIEKKVECLTMNFAQSFEDVRWHNLYAFPHLHHPLDNSNTISARIFLRKLSLAYVNISQTVAEHLISSCPNLKELAITESHCLVLLNIVGESLPLEHLKIIHCMNLKSLCLFATNLLSFTYIGPPKTDISYANVPKLVDLSVGGHHLDHFICNFPRFSDYGIRLESLALTVIDIQPNISFPAYLGFHLPCLKTLKLDVSIPCYMSILYFIPLINAAPSLSSVVVELDWCPSSKAKNRKLKGAARYPLPCLKELQINGFVGRAIDMEFVKYLLKNATALEKVVFDLMGEGLKSLHMKPSSNRREHAMEQAMLLKSKFSLGDKLVMRKF